MTYKFVSMINVSEQKLKVTGDDIDACISILLLATQELIELKRREVEQYKRELQ